MFCCCRLKSTRRLLLLSSSLLFRDSSLESSRQQTSASGKENKNIDAVYFGVQTSTRTQFFFLLLDTWLLRGGGVVCSAASPAAGVVGHCCAIIQRRDLASLPRTGTLFYPRNPVIADQAPNMWPNPMCSSSAVVSVCARIMWWTYDLREKRNLRNTSTRIIRVCMILLLQQY